MSRGGQRRPFRASEPRARFDRVLAIAAAFGLLLAASEGLARAGGGRVSDVGVSSRPGEGQTEGQGPPKTTPGPSHADDQDAEGDPGTPPDNRPRSQGAVVPEGMRSQYLSLFFLLAAVAVVAAVLSGRREGRFRQGWATASPEPPPSPEVEAAFAAARAKGEMPSADRPTPTGVVREKCRDVPAAITFLGGKDEAFSRVIFEDFVSALYSAVHAARGEKRLSGLSPYLSREAAAAYDELPTAAVSTIILASLAPLAVYAVRVPARRVDVELELEGHYTETSANGKELSYIAREIWTLSRSPDSLSRPPPKARTLGCPSCGAPVGVRGAVELGQHCPFCKEIIDTGAFDWIVTSVRLRFRNPREPILLAEPKDSENTPATVQWSVHQRYAELAKADATQSLDTFGARVKLVFETFHAARNAGDLAPMRSLLSDTFFELQPRFLAAYAAHGLRQVVERPVAECFQLVRVLRDRYYEAVTVRLHASFIHYTVDRSGRVVAGNRERRVIYSEYWTFIRSRQNESAPLLPLSCVHCGAGLVVNMAGSCEVCGVKVVSGHFDWVLSRIEQDSVYRG